MAERPVLTANGRRLVLKLAELPSQWVTAAVLAQALGISRRTVLRELQGVEDWLMDAGFAFQRSPGQGLKLDETPERREQLCLLAAQGKQQDVLPKEARREKLLGILLKESQPQKTLTLANALFVSENTLASDLDWAAQWCAPYQMELIRRPGVGVWLEGNACARRRAVSALLRSALPENQLHTALQSGKIPLAGLLNPALASAVWRGLRDFETEQHTQLSDAGFLTLLIHCVLTIQQMQLGIWEPGEFSEMPDLRQAECLVQHLERNCALQLPLEEKRHLALALEAYTARPKEEWDAPDALALRGLAAVLISSMEESLNVNLSGHPTLSKDLCSHLKPMLYRMKQGIPASNPQLETIQTDYSQLWNATRIVCNRIFPGLPDSEAGLLAMHFGAVIEEEMQIRQRLRCVVVCPYGMATGKFLAAQMMREFPELLIVKTCSVRALGAEELKQQHIDLIVSTVPLKLDYKQICVNPVLQETDRAKIQSAIQSADHQSTVPAEANAPGQLRRAGRLSALMLDLLDNLKIETVAASGSRAGLIEAAASMFCSDSGKKQVVFDALWRRETLGDTYIKPLRALLLHTRVNAVASCRLGYLRADPPVYEGGKLIQGALVLLAPEMGEEPLEVMQTVSGLLIEDPELIGALRRADRERAGSILEKGLGRQLERVLKSNHC